MPLFLPSLCVSFLFHSCCSHVRAFAKTLVHEFPISYSHTEWQNTFSQGEIICLGRSFVYHIKLNQTKLPIAILNGTSFFVTVQLHILYLEHKSRNTCAVVNLYHLN